MEFSAGGERNDLTYSDVFLVPRYSAVDSRHSVDLTPQDGTRASLPVVAANMNGVTGPRLAASLARRGGLGVLPQDLGPQYLAEAIRWVRQQPIACESPWRVSPKLSVAEARTLLPPIRGYGFVVESPEGEFLGIVPAEELLNARPQDTLGKLMEPHCVTLAAEDLTEEQAPFLALHAAGVAFAPVLERGRVVGTLNAAAALRAALYRPHLDAGGALAVGAAIGITGDPVSRARALVEAGVSALVIDTAHGHQERMLTTIEAVRAATPEIPIAAGNVVTGEAVRDLVSAGADIIKVGVGPGAMCTTRMMTAVGRPQFSAVLETAEVARQAGVGVWADGGVQYPRDVALALAAGAASVMIGSWFTGTIESPGPLRYDGEGRAFKENWGMASERAVSERYAQLTPFERAKKSFFSEGISGSRVWLDPARPSVEDILDAISAGVRSACTYTGARTLSEFHERARVGRQSAAGYDEGRARSGIDSLRGT